MGNTISENWTKYAGGEAATSHIVGYEGSRNRVMRYEFETGAAGASHIYIELTNMAFMDGSIKQPISWYIGTDADSHKNAGAGSTALGTLQFNSSYHAAEIDADITLLPNTTYYLWLFPSVSTYSYYECRTGDDGTLTLSGGAGLVYIDAVPHQAYIDNGESFDLYMPHADNGEGWELLS